MARRSGSPADGAFSPCRVEEGTISDANRRTWKVTVQSRHSSKTVEEIQVMSPYVHNNNGEGIHHIPEIGATCVLMWPNDNTPPFVLGYLGVPSAVRTAGAEEPDEDAEEGVHDDYSYRARRPRMSPGDIAITGRDGNFLIVHRGGVLQIGATAMCQRIYIPVLNYMKDFAENYALNTLGGDMAWTVERPESDPDGEALAQLVLHVNAAAQHEKASVRVRHLPLVGPGGGTRTAYDISVAVNGIDRETGDVTDEKYRFVVSVSGDQTEVIGGSREVTITGDDTLTVSGDRSASVSGSDSVAAASIDYTATGESILGGATVKLASSAAAEPGMKGQAFATWLLSQSWPVTGTGPAMVATPSPAAVAALISSVLSNKVFLE